ncbi:hypothetical protein [Bartonella sp. CB189]|uniref:hypothetical protein n=1 Tax=Bartonella sp. CB189 TaxID=3112254 RepID=UPI002F96D963
MRLFSTHSQNGKIKKGITQFKNEITPRRNWHFHNNQLDNISDMFNNWLQKSCHALSHLGQHGIELKKKAKANPKKTIALATSIALAGFLLTRKN